MNYQEAFEAPQKMNVPAHEESRRATGSGEEPHIVAPVFEVEEEEGCIEEYSNAEVDGDGS